MKRAAVLPFVLLRSSPCSPWSCPQGAQAVPAGRAHQLRRRGLDAHGRRPGPPDDPGPLVLLRRHGQLPERRLDDAPEFRGARRDQPALGRRRASAWRSATRVGGVIGNPLTFAFFDNVGGATHPALSPTIPLMLFALFQLKFAIITPALITGSFAERVRFSSYVRVHVPVQPVHLRAAGPLDLAPRRVPAPVGRARFRRRHGRPHVGRVGRPRRAPSCSAVARAHVARQAHMPANIPFVLLGTGMLWFGWFGFNAGSALAANETAVLAFATTNTASAAAMLGWMFFDVVRGQKPSALGACIGAVVGLVAITPAAGFVTVRESIVIGLVASVVSNLAVHWKTQVGARRHARRVPLPRRRRHGRHAGDGRLRQGRRAGPRDTDGVPDAPAGARHRLGLHASRALTSSTA